ncbi:MAG TPA: hypothetical protein VHS58_08420, partial [Acetobacteraceae bacterium]|nr:hypothetical protein [Acetobacteraceae bacterium]
MNLHSWTTVLACLDVLGAVTLSFIIFDLYAAPLNYNPSQLWTGVGGFVAAWCVASHSLSLYHHRTALAGRSMLVRAVATCALAFGIVLLVTFGFKLIGGISRLWLFAWAAGTIAWIIATRVIWRRALDASLSTGRCLDRALVAAPSDNVARRAAGALEFESNGGIRVVSCGPLPGVPGSPPLDWIENSVRSGAIDRVLITDFADAKEETNALLARLARLAVDVTLVPSFQGLYMPSVRVGRIGFIPVVDVAVRPLSAGQALCKRIEDVLIAGMALGLLWPL